MERNRVKETLPGLMGVHIKENFKRITYMEKAHINGLTEDCIWVLGRITKCMATVYLRGQMGEDTKVIM